MLFILLSMHEVKPECSIFREYKPSISENEETFHTIELEELSTKLIQTMHSQSKIFPYTTTDNIITVKYSDKYCSMLGNSIKLERKIKTPTFILVDAFNIHGNLLIKLQNDVRFINKELFKTVSNILEVNINLV